MNKVILIGRLTRDPEDHDTFCKYTIAVDRYKEGADFINCIAFGKSADFAKNYMSKGTKVAVTGRIQTGKYTNKDGQTVNTTDVVIETQEFCESKKQEQKENGQAEGGFVSPEEFLKAEKDLPPWLK